MNPAVLFLFLLSAPVAGCALRSGAQAGEEPRSRVDMALADASDSITRDLAILTGGNRVTAPAAPGGSLAAPVSLVFDGPLEESLERVCALTGFRLEAKGVKPDIPTMVHVRMTARPAIAVIREIGLQAGPKEKITVDEAGRRIGLEWPGHEKTSRIPPFFCSHPCPCGHGFRFR